VPTIKAQAVMANSIAVRNMYHESRLRRTADDVRPAVLRTTNDERPTTFCHCTLCSRLINFCARFSSDSDHSNRVSAPTLFSTWVM